MDERGGRLPAGVPRGRPLPVLGAPIPHDFYDINVDGTRNVLDAARRHGCERLVYTSTVGTLGLHGATAPDPVDETSFAHVDHLFGGYKQSKYVAEHEVLRAGAEGLPVVLVQPTTPVGPRDTGPTPTGRTVLEFLNGRFPGFVDTTLNIVDVEDVAHGPRPGRRTGRGRPELHPRRREPPPARGAVAPWPR